MGTQEQKRLNYVFRLTVTLIHLSLWSCLGVLTRTFVGKFFELGCDGGWGPCLKGGTHFRDLPSNMAGAFVIGLFAASSTLGLKNDKPLALLPKGHSWQDNLELQIGIRTGYCGCLTTFASWVVELMAPAIEKNQWVNMVVGFVVGLYAFVASYLIGTHAALYIDRWLLPEREDVLAASLRYRQDQMAALDSVEGDGDVGGSDPGDKGSDDGGKGSPGSGAPAARAASLQRELERWEPDLPTNLVSNAQVSMRRRLAGLSAGTALLRHRHIRARSAPLVTNPEEGGAGEDAGAGVNPLRLLQESPSAGVKQLGRNSAPAMDSFVKRQRAAEGRRKEVEVEAKEDGLWGAMPGQDGKGKGSSGGATQEPFVKIHIPGSPAELQLAVRDVGKGVQQAAKQLQHAAQQGMQHATQQGAQQAVQAAEQGVQQAMQAAEQGAQQAVHRVQDAAKRAQREAQTFMGNKTDCAALIMLLAGVVGLAVGGWLETTHMWLRQIWIETLLGPFGCILRWWLSRFNYTARGYWAWFPIGTFVANMLATTIDFSLMCVLKRKQGLGYWAKLFMNALMTGFCGSLSTVSTFVTEVVKFAELFPETVNCYTYIFMTIGGGIALGVGIYGWAVWVPV